MVRSRKQEMRVVTGRGVRRIVIILRRKRGTIRSGITCFGFMFFSCMFRRRKENDYDVVEERVMMS